MASSTTQTVKMLDQIKIGSVFLVDPTLKPTKVKPQEEEYTDAKILFFYPQSVDIHEQRKQVGISEGIVNFFLPFSEVDRPIEVIATSTFTHVMKQVEPNLWLNIVIQHPESLYGVDQGSKEDEDVEDGETIANQEMQYSVFREEDSEIMLNVVEKFYTFIQLFVGSLRHKINGHVKAESMHIFREQMTDFTRNFQKYFFSREFTQNFFWDLCFPGFYYCPIDKKSFLQAEFVQNGLLMDFEDSIEHCAVFHENYFICTSLPHLNMQTLYQYLVGTSSASSQQVAEQVGSGGLTGGSTTNAASLKVFQYKNASPLTRISAAEPQQNQPIPSSTLHIEKKRNELGIEESKTKDDEDQEAVIDIDHDFLNRIVRETEPIASLSDFTKVNPATSQTDFSHTSQMAATFLIGPQFQPKSQPAEHVDVFAPTIYMQTDHRTPDESESQQPLTPFKMLVFLGFKTMVVVFLKHDYKLNYKMLAALNTHLTRQVPILSQLLDQVVSKPSQVPLQDQDPLRFFYFSRMNLAMKLSNLTSKEVLTVDLRHILNSMHQQFKACPDCQEQQTNTSYYWIIGINSLGREIYLIFPPNYTNAKVEQEKQKIMSTYFTFYLIGK